eukprot:m.253398 g.253398  ORF g.253398 m.253398 type:complete len:87 (+) comp19132_c0_seq5:303-563(+)
MIRLPSELQQHPERADRFLGTPFLRYLCSLDHAAGLFQVYTLLFDLLDHHYATNPEYERDEFPNILHACKPPPEPPVVAYDRGSSC